jgi:hypothetical protein
MGNMRALAYLTLALTLVLGACGSGPATAPAPTAVPAVSPPPAAAASATSTAHVFVIVMENRNFAEAIAQPYTAQLAATYAVATDYHAVAHPSLPNYLALSSGSTWGITDDGYHALPPGGLGAQLTQHGVSWRAYMEGMGSNCLANKDEYAVKHNPFAYYGGRCPSNVVPMTGLEADLAAGTPGFVWITPDLCHDGHDCSSAAADDYLKTLVPKILASSAWREGGTLFVVWDEDDGGAGNQVLCLVVSPSLSAHQTGSRHDHYSLLATVEDRFGLPRLGQSATAAPFKELLTTP